MYRTTRFISAMVCAIAVVVMLYLHLQGKVGATCGLIITEAREPRIVNLKPPASIYSLSTLNSTQHRVTKVLTSQQKIERIFNGWTPSTTISLLSIIIFLVKGHLLRISFHLLFEHIMHQKSNQCHSAPPSTTSVYRMLGVNSWSKGRAAFVLRAMAWTEADRERHLCNETHSLCLSFSQLEKGTSFAPKHSLLLSECVSVTQMREAPLCQKGKSGELPLKHWISVSL